MAQGDFTKANAKLCLEAVDEMHSALPKSKKMEYLGHLNEISLFLEKCVQTAPEEDQQQSK